MNRNISELPKQVAIYTRRSTNVSGRQKLSFERQRKEIEIYCKQMNFIIVKEFSESASGKKVDRPQFKKMIDWLDVDGDRICVSYSVSRLSRTYGILDQIENRLHQFRFVETGSNVPSIQILNALMLVAKLESEAISTRVKASYQLLVDKHGKGNFKWGNPDIADQSEYGNFVKSEKTRKHWERIIFAEGLLYAQYGNTMSLIRRCEILNMQGYRTQKKKEITPQNLLRAHRTLDTGGIKVIAQYIKEDSEGKCLNLL